MPATSATAAANSKTTWNGTHFWHANSPSKFSCKSSMDSRWPRWWSSGMPRMCIEINYSSLATLCNLSGSKSAKSALDSSILPRQSIETSAKSRKNSGNYKIELMLIYILDFFHIHPRQIYAVIIKEFKCPTKAKNSQSPSLKKAPESIFPTPLFAPSIKNPTSSNSQNNRLIFIKPNRTLWPSEGIKKIKSKFKLRETHRENSSKLKIRASASKKLNQKKTSQSVSREWQVLQSVATRRNQHY